MPGCVDIKVHDDLEALSGVLELAGTGSQKPTAHVSSKSQIHCCYNDSSESVTVGVFTPQALADTSQQGWPFLASQWLNTQWLLNIYPTLLPLIPCYQPRNVRSVLL